MAGENLLVFGSIGNDFAIIDAAEVAVAVRDGCSLKIFLKGNAVPVVINDGRNASVHLRHWAITRTKYVPPQA